MPEALSESRMTNQDSDPIQNSVVHQAISKFDCAIVLIDNAIMPAELQRLLGALRDFDEAALLHLSNVASPPWQDESFRAFASGNRRRQIAIAGNVTEPYVVGLCLYCLEEGHQTFCIDMDLSSTDPARHLNLGRLTHSGAVLLSIEQFAAELSFGLNHDST
ncbi:MAG: hypothetical protein KDJ45_08700 [Hyphomicrobiaceae bacterium]|nr:hypothetical protein [Hyphomicrobiaceae bacterium]